MIRNGAAALALILALTSASHLACEWTCAADTRTAAPTTCAHERAPADDGLSAAHACGHDAAVTLGAPIKSGRLDRLMAVHAPDRGGVLSRWVQAPRVSSTSAPPGPPSSTHITAVLRI